MIAKERVPACHLAKATARVLIVGESGTGKKVAATLIHQQSHRRHRRFVAVSCALFSDTLIARRNGGRFPRAQLIAFITEDNPAVAAHGPREMPVWGPIFRALDPSDTRAKLRIENLASYLESIQAK